LNTVPRSLTGEPLTEDELAQLASKNSDMSYPEDERVEEKKTEDDVPNYTSTRVTNLEVSLEGEEADYVAVIGDIVVTAYGEGKVVSSSTETESVEVELPYGRLFVRLTETLVKKGVKAADRAPVEAMEEETPASDCHSGIWLFTDRENITHFFKPNFLPPYNTPEKKKIILDVLREEWDEKTLSWKPCGQGSMTKPKAASKSILSDESPLSKLDVLMGEMLSTINGCCTPQAQDMSVTKNAKK
jgi:hypothetical protein